MYSARKVLLYLIPIVIIVLIALILSYYNILNLPSEALILIFVGYIIAQFMRLASSYVSAYRSKKNREMYQGVLNRLGIFLRIPKLLAETSQNRTQSPEAIAVRILNEIIREYNFDSKLFITFLASQTTYSYPQEFSISAAFVDELQNSYRQTSKTEAVLWSAPSLFGTIVPNQSKLKPVLEIQEPLVSKVTFERAIASQEFGERFCLTLPFCLETPSDGLKDPTRIAGFIGILSKSFLTPAASFHFDKLVDRFETLYDRVRTEQLAMLVDDLLNRELFSEVNVPGDGILEFFIEQLTDMLRHFYNAERAELWIRGAHCSPSNSIINIVTEIIETGYSDFNTKLGESIAGYDYSLDLPIELDRFVLGYIRILRNDFPFSRFEIELLRKTERDLDNYIRDLWARVVLRRVDHDVLNHVFSGVTEFADQLIEKIVVELDVMAGFITLLDQGDSRYIRPGSDVERLTTEFTAIRKRHKRPMTAPLGSNAGLHHIYLRIRIGNEELLGSICIVHKERLTNIHLQVLKRVEAHIDNILKLYMYHPKA